MRCKNCGVPLPEGSEVCNVCGAALSPDAEKSRAEELRRIAQEEAWRVKQKMNGIAYYTGRLYKCRMIGLIIAFIEIVLSIYYMICAKSYWDFSYLLNNHQWYIFSEIFLEIAAIIVLICFMVTLNDMKKYHPRFQVSLFSILAYLVFSIMCFFVSNFLIHMMLSILTIFAMIGYVCNLYISMEEVTRKIYGKYVGRQLDPGILSIEWKRLNKFYVIAAAGDLVLMLISSILTFDNGSDTIMRIALAMELIGSVALLVVSILEVRLFQWTWDSLEHWEYTGPRPR